MHIFKPFKRSLTEEEITMVDDLLNDKTLIITAAAIKYNMADAAVRAVVITRLGYAEYLKMIDNRERIKKTPVPKVHDEQKLISQVVQMTRRGITLDTIREYFGTRLLTKYNLFDVHYAVARIRVGMIADCWYAGKTLGWINEKFYKTSDIVLNGYKFGGLMTSYPDIFYNDRFDSEPIDV